MILKHFQIVIGLYTTRRFEVTIIMADNQFESMQRDLADLGALLKFVSADEHVPEIKQYNWTIKEQIHGIYNTLPFTYIPPIFLVKMVYSCMFSWNMFALKGGISKK